MVGAIIALVFLPATAAAPDELASFGRDLDPDDFLDKDQLLVPAS
jgi:hypothetical protein